MLSVTVVSAVTALFLSVHPVVHHIIEAQAINMIIALFLIGNSFFSQITLQNYKIILNKNDIF